MGILLAVVLLTDMLTGSARLAVEVILGVLFAVLLAASLFFLNLYNTLRSPATTATTIFPAGIGRQSFWKRCVC